LARDFDELYVLDLGGNVRKNPKLSGTTHNVFGIQVGVSINLFVRRQRDANPLRESKIYYARVGEDWRKEDKYKFLNESQQRGNIEWQELQPDTKYNWLTEGMHDEFESFLPVGTKATKLKGGSGANIIFKMYSLGVSTNRDAVVYNFDRNELLRTVEEFCNNYNSEMVRFQLKGKPKEIDSFIDYEKVKWSLFLKNNLKRGRRASFDPSKTRASLYRPFTETYLYFDKPLVDVPSYQNLIFPTEYTEQENLVICFTGPASEKPFMCLMSDKVVDLHLSSPGSGTQCFPLYIYNEDGTNRRENITDWALAQFRAQYKDKSISKLDVFHYVYALLHHPTYRTTYAANLKRELPRIPFVKSAADFRALVSAGGRLADLHVNYEAQPEYRLERVENAEAALDWRVERMRLSKDKSSIVYNDFLTLEGIPPEAFEYRLGNRSALEWIIDQYQVSTDRRSGITNDPNRADEPDYIVKLIGKVTTVSVETVKIVRSLPDLQLS
jgi:predicted helicase